MVHLFLSIAITILPYSLSFTISPLNGEIRATFPKSRQPSALFETRETSTASTAEFFEAEENNDVKMMPLRFSVTRPAIHFTVPGYKVGWRDEDGNWFDEDGKRNGPPQNYWRQMSDQREYNRDMEAVTSVMTEFNVEEAVRTLEYRLSTRKPSLSRKLLGFWAPLLLGGERVALNDMPANDDGSIEVPYKINIFRTNGPKFAPKTYYGLFYAKLEVGEELTIEANTGSLRASIPVVDTNEPNPLGMVDCNGAERLLSMGGITYVSDYVLIQRNDEGAVDFWLRCDDSYLGLNDEDQ